MLTYLVLLSGCNADAYNEHGYVFDPADHYDLSNVDEALPVLWTFTTDEQIMNPVVIDGERAVYIHTDETVYAVDPEGGSLIWRHPVEHTVRPFVVPFGDILLIPAKRERVLQGIDADSGELLWELPFHNHVQANADRPQMTDIAVDDKHAYVLLSLNRGTAILAIDPQTGEVLWKSPDELAAGLSGSIFQDDEDDFIRTTGARGTWKLSKADGHIIERVIRSTKSSGRPTYADGVAYTGGGPARAVDLETGTVLWSVYPKMCTDEAEQTVFEPPILDDEIGYLLTACEFMIQVDLETGDKLWEVAIPPTSQSFEPAGEVGYALTPYGDLLEVNKSDGDTTVLLTLSPPEVDVTTYKHLASNDNLLILAPGNNQVFAFRLN